jgi:hypothetical protein
MQHNLYNRISAYQNTGATNPIRVTIISDDKTVDLTGAGETLEDAIVALAHCIKERRKSTPVTRAQEWTAAAAKAFNQPMGAASIFGEPQHGNPDPIELVGCTVWYITGPNDVEECSSAVLPAIITKAWRGNRVDLQVFWNKTPGTSNRYSVEYTAQGDKGGTWTYPKKTYKYP